MAETFEFGIYEKVTQTKKQKKDAFEWDQYDYNPSGKLILRIKDCFSYTRKGWADGKEKKLEDCLNSFIRGLYKAALAKRVNRERIERENREYKEKFRQQEEGNKIKEKELQRMKALENEAFSWHRSQIVRSYIKEAEKKHVKQNGKVKTGSEFEQWFVWANQQADRLDPLRESSEFALDGEENVPI